MRNPKGTVIAASLFAAWFFTGCDGASPFFKSTNLDPHPPVLSNLQAEPDTIFIGDVIRGSLNYFDEGADVDEIRMFDLNSSNVPTPTPPVEVTPEGEELPVGVFFFPGQSGFIEWEVTLDTNQAGLHTIKVWLVDSKESRSEPAYFSVQVNF